MNTLKNSHELAEEAIDNLSEVTGLEWSEIIDVLEFGFDKKFKIILPLNIKFLVDEFKKNIKYIP